MANDKEIIYTSNKATLTDCQEYVDFLDLLDGDVEKLLAHKKAYQKAHSHNFVEFLNNHLYNQGIKKYHLCLMADVSNQAYLNGNRKIPLDKRDMVLRICIASRMNINQTQEALRCCKMSLLDDGVYRDKIIVTGINNNKSLDTIDEWLYKAEEKSIFDKCT